jgi:hypothetical protein
MIHQQPSDSVQVWKAGLRDDVGESGRERETALAIERVRRERDDGNVWN